MAAGTALDVQSGRCTGMGGACIGMIDDSSAIFFNPAGIARGKGIDAQVGITPIVPLFSYKDNAGNKTTMPFNIVPPFNAYFTYGITEDFTAGIGVFTPYGLRIQWPDGWAGRNYLTSASLITEDINPTLAYKFGPVRLGAGFQAMHAAVHLQRDINFGSQIGSIDLGGGAWGWGANGGVQIDAIKKFLTVGVIYRSAVKTDFDDGKAHFDNVPPGLQQTIHDQKAQTSFVNPDQLALGLASRPIDQLLLDVDIVWIAWSKFHSIDINFPDDQSHTLSTSSPKNWTGKVHVNAGGEYTFSPNWKGRLGFLYDQSPSPESTLAPDLPDADRLNLAVGGSYWHDSGFHADLGFQYLIMFAHKSTYAPFPGEYGGNPIILGITLGYSNTSAGKPKKKSPDNNDVPPEGAQPPPPGPDPSQPPGATTPGI